MIPFDSWDGVTNTSGGTEQAKLEAYLGPTAVVFSSYQAAITSVLEILGSRTTDVPVILPITTSPDTLAAVLRSGASPLLLDIDSTTLQLDANLLAEILGELPQAVVVLDRPGGQQVTANLLELTKDTVTIIDTRLPPTLAAADDCVGSFTVFDFGPVIGSGGLVHHKYSEQVLELKVVRNGILGLAANMNEILCSLALTRLKVDAGQRAIQAGEVAEAYMELLQLRSVGCMPFVKSTHWPYFIVSVENSDRAIAYLHSHNILAVKPVFPLHLLPTISRRWTEKPEYPVAEKWHKHLIALPTHQGVLGKEEEIISKLLEVAY